MLCFYLLLSVIVGPVDPTQPNPPASRPTQPNPRNPHGFSTQPDPTQPAGQPDPRTTLIQLDQGWVGI